MSLKYGSREVAKMVEAIDADHASAEDAAKVALEVAEGILVDRAKFAVVAQLSGNRERSTIPASDPEAIKLVLGFYSTKGDARKAEESLRFVAATGDQFRTWSVPILHMSPAELTAQQKDRYAKAEEKAKADASERLRKQIAQRDAEAAEAARGGVGSCINCSHIAGEHGYEGSSRGACRLPECKGLCAKFIERTKAA